MRARRGLGGPYLKRKMVFEFYGDAKEKGRRPEGAAAKALRLGKSGRQKRFCTDTP